MNNDYSNNNFSNASPNKKQLMSNVVNMMVLACIDGKVSDDEQRLISSIAQSYGLTEEEYKECGDKCNESLQNNNIVFEVPKSDAEDEWEEGK